MASYWKSQPRKFCDVCKCWIGDNKASIDFHERGKSHQEKKKKQIEGIRKRSMQQAKENAKASQYLKQMEEAANKKFLQDLKEQGIKVNETEYYQKVQAASVVASAGTSKSSNQNCKSINLKQKVIKKEASKFEVATSSEPSLVTSQISSSRNSHPYGKWTTVESSKSNTESYQQHRNSTAVQGLQSNTYTETPTTFTVEKPQNVSLNFSEKQVTSLNEDSTAEPVAFKKRKVNNNAKNRSIRSRAGNI